MAAAVPSMFSTSVSTDPGGGGTEMQGTRRILVVLDGSDEAEEALAPAAEVAAAEGAELLLVVVVSSFRTVPSHDVILLTDLAGAAAQAHGYLEAIAARLPERQVRTLVTLSALSTAEVGVELIRVATEERCDLVAMTMQPGMAHTVDLLLRHQLAVLLVPRRSDSRLAGKRVPVPRFRLAPALRPGLALGGLFFVARREGGVALWALPARGQEA
jgi:nucleotide-binding universal stress UspA family protein